MEKWIGLLYADVLFYWKTTLPNRALQNIIIKCTFHKDSAYSAVKPWLNNFFFSSLLWTSQSGLLFKKQWTLTVRLPIESRQACWHFQTTVKFASFTRNVNLARKTLTSLKWVCSVVNNALIWLYLNTSAQLKYIIFVY